MSRESWSWRASSANAEQRARVTHRQRARREVGAHFLGQPKQPDVVGDRRSILADRVGNLLLRQMEIVHEPAIRVRFLDRIQVFALNVLDERDRQQLVFRNVSNDHGNFEETDALRRAPATFAGHDLVAAVDAPDHDRLDDAVGPNRARQVIDPLVVDVRARLKLVGPQQVGVDVERPLGSRDGRVGNERAQSSSERRPLFNHGGAPSPRTARRFRARAIRARATR